MAMNAACARQMARQWTHAQFRAVGAITQLGVGQVEVVTTLHNVIGKLITQGKADTVGLAVIADHIKTRQLRLFAGVLGKLGRLKSLARTHNNRAVALVKPFRLNAGGAGLRAPTFNTPLEYLCGIGDRGDGLFGILLLVHLVASGGAAQMRQAGAADEAVS